MSNNDPELKRRIAKAANKVRLQGIGLLGCGIFFLVAGWFCVKFSDPGFDRRMNNGQILGVDVDKTPVKPVHDLSNGLMSLMPFAMILIGIASVGFGGWQLAAGIRANVKQELAEEYEIEQRIRERQTHRTPANAGNSENGVRFDGIYQYSIPGEPKSKEYLRFFKDRTVVHAHSSESAFRVYVQCKKEKDGRHTAGLSVATIKFEDQTIHFTDKFSNLGVYFRETSYTGIAAISTDGISFDVKEECTVNGKHSRKVETRAYAFVEIPE